MEEWRQETDERRKERGERGEGEERIKEKEGGQKKDC